MSECAHGGGFARNFMKFLAKIQLKLNFVDILKLKNFCNAHKSSSKFLVFSYDFTLNLRYFCVCLSRKFLKTQFYRLPKSIHESLHDIKAPSTTLQRFRIKISSTSIHTRGEGGSQFFSRKIKSHS